MRQKILHPTTPGKDNKYTATTIRGGGGKLTKFSSQCIVCLASSVSAPASMIIPKSKWQAQS